MEALLHRSMCVARAQTFSSSHCVRVKNLFSVRAGAQVKGLRCAGLPARRRSLRYVVRVNALKEADDEGEDKDPYELAVTLAKPKSALGEMMAYYAREAPHLLNAAIEDQLAKLHKERQVKLGGGAESQQQEERQGQEGVGANSGGSATDSADLVLYRRMEELREAEARAQVEDLMYAAVMEKFMQIGVEPLPRLDDLAHVESVANLKMLTEGVHSKDAVELVKEHVLGVLGPASMAYSNTMIKMSKLQAAQVYAASLMFGYFLRRVDKRFHLEATLGVLPEAHEEAVDRLNRLFSQAASVEESDNPDAAHLSSPSSPEYIDQDGQPQIRGSSGGDDADSAGASATGEGSSDAGKTSTSSSGAGNEQPKRRNRLREYVESFDQQALVDTARVLSLEGAAVIETQTSALFGNIQKLQRQMQDAVGGDARTMDQVMQRIQDAVAEGSVEVVAMTVGTQRRAVLEAVAFGAFLRDVETHVDTEYHLLTPAPRPNVGGSGPQLLE